VDSAPSAEDIVVADASLAEAWRGLRPHDREILALALVEDLAVPDIAITLAISVNATSIRLHRAKKKLAELLNADAASDASAEVSSAGPERSVDVETSPRYEQSS
jgi:RNA polymerase sigma-70 factor (ECF subfamily)